MTSDFISSDLAPLIIDVCEEQLFDIVTTNTDLFCLAAANFAHQIFSHVKETYFKDYELCEMFEHCDSNVESELSKCNTCKFLLEQFKDVILDGNSNYVYETKSTMLDQMFQNVCYHFDADCQFSATLNIFKKIIIAYLSTDNIFRVCQVFKQC